MNGYTGRLFEYDFCGPVVDSIVDTPQYRSWRKALSEVVCVFTQDAEANPCQWDVSDPDGLCSDLFYYVATALGVETMADLKNRIVEPDEHERLWIGYCSQWLEENEHADD